MCLFRRVLDAALFRMLFHWKQHQCCERPVCTSFGAGNCAPMNVSRLSPTQLQELTHFSSCVIASAIEAFKVRLRNRGFTDSTIHCVFPDLPPVTGYAATAQIRTSDPAMEGRGYYVHTDWWDYLLSIPAPRVIVLQDMDNPPGLGALVGEVQANIMAAMDSVAVVTNGAVRDLYGIPPGFQLFAHNLSVSHAYAHIFKFGEAVEIGGMQVCSGDLLHGDRHGLQTVPLEIANRIPDQARRILERRRKVIDLCRSDEFSLPKLLETAKTADHEDQPADMGRR